MKKQKKKNEHFVHDQPRFMFVVVQEDEYGQTIWTFKEKKKAEQMYKLLKTDEKTNN